MTPTSPNPISPATVLRNALSLLRSVLPLALVATALGILGGAGAAGLLAFVNRALGADGAVSRGMLIGLCGMALLAVLIAYLSELLNSVLGQRIVARLRRDLCTQIAGAPFERVERLASPRLMAVLTGDLDALSGIALTLAPMIVALATALGVAAYLAWLSPGLSLIAAVALGTGAVANARAKRKGMRGIEAAREAHDDLLQNFRAMIDGGKEIRLSKARRTQLVDGRLVGAIDRIAGRQIAMRRHFALGDASASALHWMSIILVLAIDPAGAAPFVLALLFLRGPIEQIVAALPLLGRAQVALGRVLALFGELGPVEDIPPASPARQFGEISLRNVSYAYPGQGGASGAVIEAPDLTVTQGEIVFLTGENGAGKSTLLKLLAGLYAPATGTATIDGRQIAPADRELFSAVFYDFHLFEDLVLPDDLAPGEIDGLLERLELAGKVRVENGRLSVTSLSTGQRRRLALLQVYLDRRPVVLLDEWAAEQDPRFRRIFYEELLPEMRRRGTTVVAVSHDDRFFGAADRCIVVIGDAPLRCAA